jgi:hypothetical protein
MVAAAAFGIIGAVMSVLAPAKQAAVLASTTGQAIGLGIRLKTGRTTEAEPFDGLCVRQGDSSTTAQPSDQSRESGRRLS